MTSFLNRLVDRIVLALCKSRSRQRIVSHQFSPERQNFNAIMLTAFLLPFALSACATNSTQPSKPLRKSASTLNSPLLPPMKSVVLDFIAIETAFAADLEALLVDPMALHDQSALKVCNLAPYSMRVTIKSSTGLDDTIGRWVTIVDGDCHVEQRRHMLGADPQFAIYAENLDADRFSYVNRRLNEQIRSDDDPSNDQWALEISNISDAFGPGETCISSATGERSGHHSSRVSPVCESGAKAVSFWPAERLDAETGEYVVVIEHPNLALVPITQAGVDLSKVRAAQQAAKNLGAAVRTQLGFEAQWLNRPLPFFLGADIVDDNGPLYPGVRLTNISPKDIFGRPLPYNEGDILVRLNGNPVFGTSDVYQHLINHGGSRRHGIGVRLSVQMARQSCPGRICPPEQSSYFFNLTHGGYSDVGPQFAFWNGLVDAPTFGMGSTSQCAALLMGKVGVNIVTAATNALMAAADYNCSKNPGQCRNHSYGSRFEYQELPDVVECRWQNIQQKAASQQQHPDLYLLGSVMLIATPSAVRAFGTRITRRGAERIVGRGAAAAFATDLALEMGETVLWGVGTAAPGSSLAERVQIGGVDGAKWAPAAAGLALVSGFASSKYAKSKAVQQVGGNK